MSHISGLFARRAFNVEGILCLPLVGCEQSVVFLLVNEDDRLEQLERQLAKLEDVLSIELVDAGIEIFRAVAAQL
jgi:acetolactate synthase-1/3 small subunit